MLRLLAYLLRKGTTTTRVVPNVLGEDVIGLPGVTSASCAKECRACIDECPTDAITESSDRQSVIVDRGACIGCNYCVTACPTGTLVNDRSTAVFSLTREGLSVAALAGDSRAQEHAGGVRTQAQSGNGSIFSNSLSVRIVSTGCSACDLELSAAGNPIFDMDRFGIHVVASPRYADALVITGPVPKAMHEALLSCYQAMAEPRLVIACGTCAISGGVHAHGYAEANGVDAILPVDVYIPGCPPRPLQILRGLLAARKLNGERSRPAAGIVRQPLKQDNDSARSKEVGITPAV